MDSVDITQVSEVIKTPKVIPSEYKGEKNRQVVFFIEGYQGEFKVSTKAKDITITAYPDSSIFVLEPSEVTKKFQILVELLDTKEKIVVPVVMEHEVVPELEVVGMDELPTGDYFVAYGPIEFTIRNADCSNPDNIPNVIAKRGKLTFEDGIYKLEPDSSNDVDIIIEGGRASDGAKLTRLVKGVVFRSKNRLGNPLFPLELARAGNSEWFTDGIRLNTDDEDLTPDYLHYGPRVGDTIIVRSRVRRTVNRIQLAMVGRINCSFTGNYATTNSYNSGNSIEACNNRWYNFTMNFTVTSSDFENSSDMTFQGSCIVAMLGGLGDNLSFNKTFKLRDDYGIDLVKWEEPIDLQLPDMKSYEGKYIEKFTGASLPNIHTLSNIKYGRTIKARTVSGNVSLFFKSINPDGTAEFTLEPTPGIGTNFASGKIEIKGKGNKPVTFDVVVCPELRIDGEEDPVLIAKGDNFQGHVTKYTLTPHVGIWSNSMSFPKATVIEGDVKVSFETDNHTAEKRIVLTGGTTINNKIRLEGYWYNLPKELEAVYEVPKVITVKGEKDVTGVYLLDKLDETKQVLTITCLDDQSFKFKIIKGRAKATLTQKGKDHLDRFVYELTLGYSNVDNIEILFTCKDHPDVTIEAKYKDLDAITTDENVYTYIKSDNKGTKHLIRVYDVIGTLTATVKEGDIKTEVNQELTGAWVLTVEHVSIDFNRILLESHGNTPKEIIVFFIQAPVAGNKEFKVISHATGSEVIGDTIELEVVDPTDVSTLVNYSVKSPSPRVHLKTIDNKVEASTQEADGTTGFKSHVVFNAEGYNAKLVEVRWKDSSSVNPGPGPNPGPNPNPGGGTTNPGQGGSNSGVQLPTGPTQGIRPPGIGAVDIYKTTVSNEAIHVLQCKPEEVKTVKVKGHNIYHYFDKIDGKDVVKFYIYGGSPGKAEVDIIEFNGTITTIDVEFIYDGTIYYSMSHNLAAINSEIHLDLELIAGDGTKDTLDFLGAEDIYAPNNLVISKDPVKPNRLICTTDIPGSYHILLYKYGYTPRYVNVIIFKQDIVSLSYDDVVNYIGETAIVQIKGTNPEQATLTLANSTDLVLTPDPKHKTLYRVTAKTPGKDTLVVSTPGMYTCEYNIEFKDLTRVKLLADMQGKYWLSQNCIVTLPNDIKMEDIRLSNPNVTMKSLKDNKIILSSKQPGDCNVSVHKRGYDPSVLLIQWENDQQSEITIDNYKPVFSTGENVEVTVLGIDTDYTVKAYCRVTGVKANVEELGNNKFTITPTVKGRYVITVDGYCVVPSEAYFYVEEAKPNP